MTVKEAITVIKRSKNTLYMIWTEGDRPLIIRSTKKYLIDALEHCQRVYPGDDHYDIDLHIGDGFISIYQINSPKPAA